MNERCGCPYCKDTGYFHVPTPDGGTDADVCDCQKPHLLFDIAKEARKSAETTLKLLAEINKFLGVK